MKSIETNKSPKAVGPYSQGIISGNTLYVSGQLPYDVDGNISNDIRKQTTQCLTNIKNIVEEAGFSMSDAVKMTIFVKDLSEFSKINEEYAKFFKEPFPARSCVEVSSIPKNASIEIDGIFVKN